MDMAKIRLPGVDNELTVYATEDEQAKARRYLARHADDADLLCDMLGLGELPPRCPKCGHRFCICPK